MENSDSIKINLNSDGEILINDNANVVVPNLMATNGVIHAIDRVLISPELNVEEFLETCLPPSPTKSPTSPTSASFRPSDPPTIAPVVATTEPTEAPLLDIPDTAAEYGFTTFVALLSAPGSDGPPLVDAVTFPPFAGPFTGFAPTNAAFDLLVEREGQELLDCLLLPRYENERYEVLSYHFADLVWKTQDFVDNQILDMKNGDISLITIEENTDINDAAIEQANLMASNEVLHGINRVLFPPGFNVTEFLEECQSPAR